MTKFDVSMVPNAAERFDCKRLFDLAEDARMALEKIDDRPAVDEKFDALEAEVWAEYRAKALEFRTVAEQKIEVLKKQRVEEKGTAEALAAYDAALKAYENAPGDGLLTEADDDDGREQVVCCAVTGVPLYDTDNLLSEEDGDRHALVSIVFPDQSEADKAEADAA